MAKVIECDACRKVDLPEKTYVIDMGKRKSITSLYEENEKRLELCSECFYKVLEVLGVDKQEYNLPAD